MHFYRHFKRIRLLMSVRWNPFHIFHRKCTRTSKRNFLHYLVLTCTVTLITLYIHVFATRCSMKENVVRLTIESRNLSFADSNQDLISRKYQKISIGQPINFTINENETCVSLHKPAESDIRKRHDYWQVQGENNEDIVVYSAFYDDRPMVGFQPWIRVLGVRRLSNKNMWCYVWYSETDTPFVTEAEIIENGIVQSFEGGKTYSQNLFSCQLKSATIIPTHVSLATRLCEKSTIFLPVTIPQKSTNWIQDFGACLEVNFGYFPPEIIIEWMEVNKIFGISQINIYNGSMDSRLDRVFEYYQKKGYLEIRQMPPAVEDYSINGIRLASPASLNDCMLRNMYTKRFLVIIDFDEIIVPRLHNNYLEMLQYIDRSSNRQHPYHTYSFRNAYFFQYFSEDESQPIFLRTLRHRQRAPPSDYLFGIKSFVDPRQCKSVFNHYCWVRFDSSGDLSVDVNSSVALSHHYRAKCPLDVDGCDQYSKDNVLDNIMLKYKDILMERVSLALKNIGLK